MKLKKGIKKTFKIFIILVVVLILLVIGYFGYKRFFDTPKVKTTTIVDKIGDYGYELKEDAPKKYKEYYESLRKLLQKETFDEQEYAKLVAQLLVFDFYNLDNKISKNDVGGTQFIKADQIENFVLEAEETVYKYIEHNVYGNRTQELPVVTDVVVKTITETTYKYKTISDEKAYKVVINPSYEKDLSYPSEVTVVLIHDTENTKKLVVIKMY